MNAVEEYGRIDTIVTESPEDVRKIIEGDNKLNIMHLNIRSLRKNFDELIIYLDELKIENVDIIILSETWQIDEVRNFHIHGYDLHYNESYFNQNDGLIIYTKELLHISNVEKIVFSDINLLRCTFEINKIIFGITCTYRPPSTDINFFLNDLNDYIINLNMKNIEIFIGDLNINILDTLDNNVNDYLNILAKRGFFSFINKPTRQTAHSSTVIDHIFVKSDTSKNKNMEMHSAVYQTSLTDHYTIILSINICESYSSNNDQGKKYIKRIDYEKLKLLLQQENWDEVINCEEAEEANSLFMSKLSSYIQDSSKNYYITSKNRKIKTWITLGIVKSIRHRDKMKKQLIENFSFEADKQYKQYRNKLKKIIKDEKNNYYKQKILDSNKNYKQIWGVINEITNKSSHNNTQNINLRVAQGNIIRYWR